MLVIEGQDEFEQRPNVHEQVLVKEFLLAEYSHQLYGEHHVVLSLVQLDALQILKGRLYFVEELLQVGVVLLDKVVILIERRAGQGGALLVFDYNLVVEKVLLDPLLHCEADIRVDQKDELPDLPGVQVPYDLARHVELEYLVLDEGLVPEPNHLA